MIFYTADNYDSSLSISKTPYRHGKHGCSSYDTWHNMKQRCINKNSTEYYLYGGSGIGICESWLDFINFYNDMGERPRNHDIDRIDNKGGYCKENCRWVKRNISNFNKRAFNKTGLPRGVHKIRNKFRSSISIDDISYHIGVFNTKEEASDAYINVCMEWYGFIAP